MIPYARQDICEEDIEAVIETLRSPWLTQGPVIEQFERAMAEFCGAQYAVAVSSGTAALHIACLAAGLGPDHALWTSPNTFVASANCGRYCGATVDFVDIDSKTYNMSPQKLEEKLERIGRGGLVPSVLVPVHFSGQPCEMREIAELAREYRVETIIEDASHAVGATYLDAPVGSCAYSDMTVFSFHPVKIITSGEGGMILTNRADLAERLRLYRSHGITRDARLMTGAPDGIWYYEQVELGFNYRMTDIHAVLGLSQSRRMNEFLARRRQLARRYDELLQNLPITLPWQHQHAMSSWHLYVIRVGARGDGRTRAHVFQKLRNAGITVNVHYIPVHTQPYYTRRGFKYGDFPESERFYEEAISIPMYPALTDEEQDFVVAALRDALQ